ncbi:MAG: ABC transporter ATP-binding protein [Pseudomonadota bacterium]
MSSPVTSAKKTDTAPPEVEILHLSKRFGPVRALDDVSIRFRPGCFHALLGENGAGKSTLVKCLMGFYRADDGQIAIAGRERQIEHPQDVQALGLGMVYQHFTLVEPMSVAENLVLARAEIPARIDWKAEKAAIVRFMESAPFSLDPDAPVATLAAGEKQKLEILKQLWLGRRFLVLDEPTSVLTPAEADDVLGEMRRLSDAGVLSVVLITHKFREVMAFAAEVSVLRGGRLVGGARVAETDQAGLASMMFGEATPREAAARAAMPPAAPYLAVEGLSALSDRGTRVVDDATLAVAPGEIVGVAGVSGNGQKELVEVLAGQRSAAAGRVLVGGTPYGGTRHEIAAHGVFLLAEEPLANAAVRRMSVMENLMLRRFDRPPAARGPWLDRGAMRRIARDLIARYRIRTPGPDAPLHTLSGGNVQRTVLARELSEAVHLLVAQNPCFGLDASAAAEIRSQMVEARNRGAAILLISEDLDEILALSDRILVMSGGRIVHETTGAAADRYEIGRHMAEAPVPVADALPTAGTAA